MFKNYARGKVLEVVILFKISEHDLIKYSERCLMTQNCTRTFLPCHWWNVYEVLQDTEGEV